MQLADRRRAEVQRSVGGREATAHPVVCGRHLASHCRLVSTSHVSPLCESTHTTALPEFSTALPMTPNIYYQRQPCLTNNSQAFTQCGTAAAGQATRRRGAESHAFGSRTQLDRGFPAVADIQRAALHRRSSDRSSPQPIEALAALAARDVIDNPYYQTGRRSQTWSTSPATCSRSTRPATSDLPRRGPRPVGHHR